MNHLPAPKNKPKQTQFYLPTGEPALLALRSFSEWGSAAEGAVEKFLSLCPESATIIRKSVIRQFKRYRLDWRTEKLAYWEIKPEHNIAPPSEIYLLSDCLNFSVISARTSSLAFSNGPGM